MTFGIVGGNEMGSEDHGRHRGATSVRTLATVAGINLVGFAVELGGGLLFGSVALLGDALHMLFDAFAYVLALGAAVVVRRTDPSERWTYGLQRAEPFAAFLNGILLVPMVAFLVFESYQRYLSPITIDVGMTILFAAGGLIVNLGSIYVLQGGSMSLNERGAYYHLIGDAGASVAVIVSMVVVKITGAVIVDPITAVVIAVLIVWSAVKLLRESLGIFFQESPVSTTEMKDAIAALKGVEAVRDVHIWALSSTLRVATVHVTDAADTLEEREAIQTAVTDLLHAEFGVDHVTVEVRGNDSEFDPVIAHGPN